MSYHPLMAQLSLETASLTLRPLVSEDVGSLVDLMEHPDTRSMALAPQFGERGEIEKFLRGVQISHETGGPLKVFAMIRREGGAFIGVCGLVSEADRPRVEFFCAVLPKFRGQGLASEAAERLTAEAFLEERIEEVVCHVAPDNAASIRGLEKLGFRDQGLIDHPLSPEKMRLFGFSRQPSEGQVR